MTPSALKQLHSSLVTPHSSSARQLDLVFEELQSARRVWPVRELVERVRELVEQRHSDVWVEGEISNFRPAPSGHIYFTLKDAEAQLPVVLFRRQALLLRFRPEDGLHVLVRGRVSVYEQRGQLQLVAETMEPVGAGSLQLAFEQLKERLKVEGLFDAARKRPLPAFPRTVGIVTSPTGAVIRDFLNIVRRRHSGLNVLLFPVPVQGESAPAEIEAALLGLNASTLVDVIVLARGGGSLEDLAAFNSERVARAIAASQLPVVSAIGHETDFTIADFAADLRAPTPSAAAELITEAQHNIAERVDSHTTRLERAARYRLLQAHRQLDALPVDRTAGRVTVFLHRLDQRLDDLGFRMEAAVVSPLRIRQREVTELTAAVSASRSTAAAGGRSRAPGGLSNTARPRSGTRTPGLSHPHSLFRCSSPRAFAAGGSRSGVCVGAGGGRSTHPLRYAGCGGGSRHHAPGRWRLRRPCRRNGFIAAQKQNRKPQEVRR